MALIDKLTAIGNGFRESRGTTTKYTLDEMAVLASEPIGGGGGNIVELEITSNGTYTAPEGVDGYSPIVVSVPQDGTPTAQELVVTGNCSYRFANSGWDWVVNKYGAMMTTKEISNITYMFQSSNLETIPFEIVMSTASVAQPCSLNRVFNNCKALTAIPKITNARIEDMPYAFAGMNSIRYFPNDFDEWFDWGYLDNITSAYSGTQANLFESCYSLRSVPIKLLKHGNPNLSYSYVYFYSGFSACRALDELVGLPIPYINATWTSNAFKSTFNNCSRLKNLTFETNDDGTPKVMKWKSQTIDLSQYVGYVYSSHQVTDFNSGITADKEVTDDATYQALKNDPDWFTTNLAYSRYNHDSAVATINSLPDTSAYLASASGTNTIKFKGASGSATDGGAINTITEEEIAVATAKGWTVTLV